MTKFTDGPAKGETLMLKRAPIFLRVVVSHDGKVDALDQLTDEPAANETVYAYALTCPAGTVHLNMRRGRGGFYSMAEYRMIDEQPTDATMRDTGAWREWCQAKLK